MPASTFPTKSAPTSAPFVKIPPPSRAKIEISEAPNPNAIRAFINSLLSKEINVSENKRAKMLWAMYCLEVWKKNFDYIQDQ